MNHRVTPTATISWPVPDDLIRAGTFACLDFVNSEWTDWRGEGEPTDRLNSPDWWRRFFSNWGISAKGLGAPAGPRLADLRKARQMMRLVIEKRRMPTAAEVSWLNGRLARSPQVWRLIGGRAGPTYRIKPIRTDWSGVTTLIILSFIQLMNDSDLSRLKRCGNPDCSYLFYDISTNRSRRWCFSNVCGNLMHVRNFRARRTS